MDILYKKTSKGDIQVWKIDVKEVNNYVSINTITGKLDGKRTSKSKIIKEGKNIGKKNETTALEQAQKEAASSHQKKLDSGYFSNIDTARNTVVFLPMLAHDFTKRGHDIVYPASVQPKLDGVRCLIHKNDKDTVIFWSRGSKKYEVLQLHKELVDILLERMPVGAIWDGEIYKHGWSLQRIVSAVKKYKNDTVQLQFWAFDVPSQNDNYLDRYANLTNRIKFHTYIKLTPTYSIKEKKEVNYFHNKFVLDGYEGVIIRNDASYEYAHRSKDLQKFKKFQEGEFKIVDTYPEVQTINGVQITSICFWCENIEGVRFKVRPKGTLEDRQEMWTKKNSYIGKYLTVRYFTLTDATQGQGKAVPQFPVGIITRDYE